MAFRPIFSPIPLHEAASMWFRRAWNYISNIEEWTEIGVADAPAFENSWANVGGAYETASFYKDPYGRVFLKGAVDTGSAGTTAFTLPINYRPSSTLRIAVNDGGNGYVEITSAGGVQPQAPASYLDGVSFRAEQ